VCGSGGGDWSCGGVGVVLEELWVVLVFGAMIVVVLVLVLVLFGDGWVVCVGVGLMIVGW